MSPNHCDPTFNGVAIRIGDRAYPVNKDGWCADLGCWITTRDTHTHHDGYTAGRAPGPGGNAQIHWYCGQCAIAGRDDA